MDAGDIIHYDKNHDARYDRFIVEAMNQMHYDAVTLGEVELERGPDYVRDLVSRFKGKVVLANVKAATGTTPWQETAVIKVGGRRVGVFGLMSNNFGRGPEVFEDEGWKIEDPMAAMARVLPELRKRSDVVVALAHLEAGDSHTIALAAAGVDVVVPGHMPGAITTQPDSSVTTVFRCGQRGEYLGVARVTGGGKAGKVQVDSLDAIMLEMSKFPEDPKIAAELAEIKTVIEAEARKAQLERELKQTEGLVLGQDRYLGDETCARCHSREVEQLKTSPHARAFATLEAAGKANDSSCLPCHVTGYNQPGGFGGLGTAVEMKNVQCESCHGMGTNHDWSRATAAAAPSEATCKTCHVPQWSPKFEYTSYLKKLGHGTHTD